MGESVHGAEVTFVNHVTDGVPAELVQRSRHVLPITQAADNTSGEVQGRHF